MDLSNLVRSSHRRVQLSLLMTDTIMFISYIFFLLSLFIISFFFPCCSSSCSWFFYWLIWVHPISWDLLQGHYQLQVHDLFWVLWFVPWLVVYLYNLVWFDSFSSYVHIIWPLTMKVLSSLFSHFRLVWALYFGYINVGSSRQ